MQVFCAKSFERMKREKSDEDLLFIILSRKYKRRFGVVHKVVLGSHLLIEKLKLDSGSVSGRRRDSWRHFYRF